MADVLNRVGQYFNDIADTLAGDKDVSAVFPNTSDKGIVREEILVQFLTKHLPTRCEVLRGGFIFDSEGNESKQIDLIITNDITLQFKQNSKAFNCVEGCSAAISVKSTLDKLGLTEAVLNLASIPQLPDVSARFSPIIPLRQREEYQRLPFRVIFAFDGMTPDSLTNSFSALVQEHKLNEFNAPDLIIVNRKYYVAFPRMFSLEPNKQGELRAKLVTDNSNVGGMALLYLLTRLQYIANFSPHVAFSFNAYHDAIATIT